MPSRVMSWERAVDGSVRRSGKWDWSECILQYILHILFTPIYFSVTLGTVICYRLLF